MKNHFAEGLDKAAMDKFRKHVRTVTAGCTNGRGLLEHAAAQDFNPMISKAFAMRYACRQQGCGLAPKSEAGCAACGGEFKYGLGAGGLDSRGQDKDYQHIIFMQIPWGDGSTKTMCA